MNRARLLALSPLALVSIPGVVGVAAGQGAFLALSGDDHALHRVSPYGPSSELVGVIEPLAPGAEVWELTMRDAQTLYALDTANDRVLTIDASTGAVTRDVALDTGVGPGGLTIAPDGALLGLFPGLELREIDPVTGATTLRATITGVPSVDDVFYSLTGELWAAGSIGMPDDDSEGLWIVDDQTGVASFAWFLPVADMDSVVAAGNGSFYSTIARPNVDPPLARTDPFTAATNILGFTGVTNVRGMTRLVSPYEDRIDGRNITTDFAPADLVATQRRATAWGDNVNELNQLFVSEEPDGLLVGVTGNVDNNGNGIMMFFDVRPDGQSVLNMTGSLDVPQQPPRLNGARMDPGFTPDTMILMNNFETESYVNRYDLAETTGVTNRFVGGATTGSGTPFLWIVSPLEENFNGMLLAFDDSNGAGVTGDDASAAPSATTGLEAFIPWADLGLAGPPEQAIRVQVALLGSPGLSTQYLPSLEEPVAQLGASPDYVRSPGDQFATLLPARQTIRVAPTAPPPLGGGVWDDALFDLSDALNLARLSSERFEDVEVWVGAGEHTPGRGSGLRETSFALPSGVRVVGGFAGDETARDERDPEAHRTVLTGDLNNDDDPALPTSTAENALRVVTAFSTGAGTLLEGVTVTAGRADVSSLDDGGGLSAGSATLGLRDVYFTRNHADDRGGAITIRNSDVHARHLTITDNTAGVVGGAIRVWDGSDVTLVDAVITGNSSQFAGAVGVDRSRLEMRRGLVSGNSATITGTLFFQNSDAEISGSVIAGNSAGFSAGLHFESDTSGTNSALVTNTLVAHNTATSARAGLYNEGPDTRLVNTILWGNEDGDGVDDEIDLSVVLPGTLALTGVIVEGGYPGAIDADPLFVDPLGPDRVAGTGDEDYRLRTGSSAIDAADRALGVPDTDDLDDDGNTLEPVPFDLAGAPRYVDDIARLNAFAFFPAMDIGPYEFQAPLCFDDANFDGRFDIEDLYSTVATGADMNGDGVHNATDIACVVERLRLYEVADRLRRGP